MHICQHITIGNVRHCICIMHETRITISCISCIPVPVTCRPDTLILVVIVVACVPAEAQCARHNAWLHNCLPVMSDKLCDSNRIFKHGICHGPLRPMDSYIPSMLRSRFSWYTAPAIMKRGIRCTDPSNPNALATLRLIFHSSSHL